ncbi:MAG: LssY C-terminal domain-containing protein [Candidatus Saccharimonadales bacterium]
MKRRYQSIDDLVPLITIHSYSKDHVLSSPVSLIVVGRKSLIIKSFQQHGWFLAEQINPISAVRAGLATFFNLSYHKGPMYDSYVDGRPHVLGFEKPTQTDSFRRRHHLRLWKTRYYLNHKPVWIGTISYDRGVGLKKGSLLPIHHTNPTLRLEEDFLAKTFGVQKPIYVVLSRKESGTMYSGDSYIWDGQALLIEIDKRNTQPSP